MVNTISAWLALYFDKDFNMKREYVIRSCSVLKPVMFLVLELYAVYLLAVILSGGHVFGALGLVVMLTGAVFPVGKFPVFFKRAKTCKKYSSLNNR